MTGCYGPLTNIWHAVVPQWQQVLWLACAAAIVSAAGIWLIRPLLLKHALAKPNARSSHLVPTPQGAGLAVIAATLVVAGAALFGTWDEPVAVVLFGATLFIAALGFVDDLKPVPVFPRLLLQAIAVGSVVWVIPCDLRVSPLIPFGVERALVLLAGVWFVNLVNFMDGLDWMTVAEVVPITATLAILGVSGDAPPIAAIVAAALCGAMIGFAPFNRPVAKIFLGDVGSLPIGLLLGWCLLQLAGQRHLAAALLLPLYYLADATITLLWRLAHGEAIWTAHRSHFYQRATDNGFSVLRVVSEVFALNLWLAAVAVTSIAMHSATADAAGLVLGAAAVAFVLFRFSRKRS
jgi:UDP-N-acetylmuramyl pentapeptide phosphotransferase/UDP-N-acetylglucosamine-1-phosphate transferase